LSTGFYAFWGILSDNINMTFQDRVKNEMKKKNWIVKELALRADLSTRTVEKYLGARESLPMADNAVKIAKALDVSVEYLVTGHDPGPPDYSESVKDLLKDLVWLTETDIDYIKPMIHTAAERRRDEERTRKTSG
jgi:transcriptional regulator with XRE-family HTH domain